MPLMAAVGRTAAGNGRLRKALTGAKLADADAKWQMSDVGLGYVAGLLKHARGCVAVTNPLVNSYKRLVPGYEAPTNVAWSMRNRSPMVRIPDRRGQGT